MSPQQGFGQAQYIQPGGRQAQVPSQFGQPEGRLVQVPSQFGQPGRRLVQVPSQFGQPGLAEERQEYPAFIEQEVRNKGSFLCPCLVCCMKQHLN